MKSVLFSLLVLALPSAGCSGDQSWSEPVNDLRARLSIERDEDSPFLKIFLEFQNVSDVGAIRMIRWTPWILKPTVTDIDGAEVERIGRPYSGSIPDWKPLTLPTEGTLRFLITFPGLAAFRDETIIDLGSRHCWAIPEEAEWFLSGSLTIDEERGDDRIEDWSGTLSLPKVRIPKGSKLRKR